MPHPHISAKTKPMIFSFRNNTGMTKASSVLVTGAGEPSWRFKSAVASVKLLKHIIGS